VLGLGLICFGVAFSASAFAKTVSAASAIRVPISLKLRDAWVAGDANALSQPFTLTEKNSQVSRASENSLRGLSCFVQQYADV